MKPLLFALLCFLPFSGYSQKISYNEWAKESKKNMRLLPEYGHRPKSEGQMEADRKFIESCLKTDTTHRKASEHMVRTGWTYFYNGDIRTAMYRFNQAWLLDPTNENSYWGFGAIYCHFFDEEKALEMYDKGLAINPNSSKILTDKATIYFGRLYKKIDKRNKKRAIDLFSKSLAIDPDNMNTLFKMSALYFLLDDCDNALKFFNECDKRGGEPITDDFVKDLNKRCGKKIVED